MIINCLISWRGKRGNSPCVLPPLALLHPCCTPSPTEGDMAFPRASASYLFMGCGFEAVQRGKGVEAGPERSNDRGDSQEWRGGWFGKASGVPPPPPPLLASTTTRTYLGACVPSQHTELLRYISVSCLIYLKSLPKNTGPREVGVHVWNRCPGHEPMEHHGGLHHHCNHKHGVSNPN